MGFYDADPDAQPFTASKDGEELALEEVYRGGALWNTTIADADADIRIKWRKDGLWADVSFNPYHEEFPLKLVPDRCDVKNGKYVFEYPSGPYDFTVTLALDTDEYDELPPVEQPMYADFDHPLLELACGDTITITTVPGSGRKNQNNMGHEVTGEIVRYEDRRRGVGAVAGGEVCEISLETDDSAYAVTLTVSEDYEVSSLTLDWLDGYHTRHIESIKLENRKINEVIDAPYDISGFPVKGPKAGTNASVTEGKDVYDNPLEATVRIQADHGWLDADSEALHGYEDDDVSVEVTYDARYGDGEKTVSGTVSDVSRQEYRYDSDAAVHPRYTVHFVDDEGDKYQFILDENREIPPEVTKHGVERSTGLGRIQTATID